jgi:hypothetical protein
MSEYSNNRRCPVNRRSTTRARSGDVYEISHVGSIQVTGSPGLLISAAFHTSGYILMKISEIMGIKTLYPQTLALTLRTSGGRSVGIVRSQTQATEFSLVLVYGPCN